MDELYNSLHEYERNKINVNTFNKRLLNNEIVKLNGKKKIVIVGKGLKLKVNTSLGFNNLENGNVELEKIHRIANNSLQPDIMMDLSTVKSNNPLYEMIGDFIGCPVGTIPYYICFDKKKGIDKKQLLETIEQQAERGVAFMTLHLTANLSLAEKTLNRKIPIISRGGSILLRDIKLNGRKDNILIENLDDILKSLKKKNVVISIGTTFRPSTLYDAMDEVNLLELKNQIDFAKSLIKKGHHVLLEGIGHIPINYIKDYVNILRKEIYIPFMPLGPIVSDRTKGNDCVTSAIGATFMASLEGADIINTITREEHTGGIPTIDSIIDAINTSKAVVEIINDQRFFDYFNRKDGKITNCMQTDKGIGCERCGLECPFLWNE